MDTLNPVQAGGKIRLRCTHHHGPFEAIGVAVYVSPDLGRGVYFSEVAAAEQSKLDRWLNNPDTEF